jgi:hypothetical protein
MATQAAAASIVVTYRCSRWEPGRTSTWLPTSEEWLAWVRLSQEEHIGSIQILRVERVGEEG